MDTRQRNESGHHYKVSAVSKRIHSFSDISVHLLSGLLSGGQKKRKEKKKACIRQLHVCHSFYWLDGLDREKKLTLEIAVHLITSDIRMQSAGAY